jgi:23S rRNA (adenine2503-C2)-methyltransferase
MNLQEKCSKSFANGSVYLLHTEDGLPIETTDTFLPYYTKDAIGSHQNELMDYDLGSRSERWMIGVSTMSGCPVGCNFCATGKLKKWRNLTAQEMIDQVRFILDKHWPLNPAKSKEFKINWTRMGEPFLNIPEVKKAIAILSLDYPNVHHYVSTVGIRNSDFSWIKGNITLQLSVHSFDEDQRDWLIPIRKMSLEEMGQVRTESNLKTTVNLSLVREEDFVLKELVRLFPKEHFFVKLSPINPNDVSDENNISSGVIKTVNLV